VVLYIRVRHHNRNCLAESIKNREQHLLCVRKRRSKSSKLSDSSNDIIIMNRRITKPPGGDASDIFGSNSPTTTPPTTPRKVKNYLASNIFSAGRNEPTHQSKSRQRPDDDSFGRLFGPGGKDAPDGGSPARSVKNYQKSNIINEASESNGKVYANGDKNGHASPNGHGSDSGMGSGSVTPNGSTNGSSNGSTNGDVEPRANGHTNGHGNGHGNGHIDNGTPVRRPPGGYSSIGNIFSP